MKKLKSMCFDGHLYPTLGVKPLLDGQHKSEFHGSSEKSRRESLATVVPILEDQRVEEFERVANNDKKLSLSQLIGNCLGVLI